LNELHYTAVPLIGEPPMVSRTAQAHRIVSGKGRWSPSDRAPAQPRAEFAARELPIGIFEGDTPAEASQRLMPLL